MTAVAAPYEDLIVANAPLTETVVERLEDERVASLRVRFRSFLESGWYQSDAPLLAVGCVQSVPTVVAAAPDTRPVFH